MKKKIVNKDVKKLVDFVQKELSSTTLVHNLSNWATEFQVIKRRKVIKVTLEFPLKDVSSRGDDASELISLDVFEASNIPVIPLLLSVENNMPINNKE